MELPPDGVCDFIFYDSLREPFDKLGRPSRGKFKTFQTIAAAKAADISKPSATKRVASYTFLGYYGKKQVACEEAAQHLQSIYTPHVVVFLGHISFKEDEIATEVPNFVCIIVPPSIYEIPPSVKAKLVYGHTYEAATSMVTCISQKGINPPPVYAISVTLKGRWYTPKVDDIGEQKIGAYGVFEQCESFREYTIPQLICTKTKTKYLSNLELNDTGLYMQTYDKKPGTKQTLVFDSTMTQVKKICDARYKDKTHAYTIAAYDVNYDYAPSACPQKIPGGYSRTQSYKKLVTFLAHFNGKQQADCLAIING
ncbi:uncharacterized protein [Dermacentor andersoni]|uniref:uncharacterized protein n=1 Tax=Dermacentor andersoni TaxID=34620 RepID=UPI003B3B0A12